MKGAFRAKVAAMRRLLLFAAGLAVLFAACAGTSPRRMSRRPVAIVRCGEAPKIGRIQMEALDGFVLRKPGCRIEVSTGTRTVEISFVYGDGVSAWTSAANCPLTFDAQAGKVYTVNAKTTFAERTWTGWVEDVVEGKILDQCQGRAGN